MRGCVRARARARERERERESGVQELCVKVEEDVLGSPSLIVFNMVSVDVNQH